ncbi:GspH/FimT family protein [Shewanella sp. AS16]|uniref:GspH/FimT family pseudopilin n=1 Tax=Shewanella sp. AS16 TaxID=2907625 RepID=UPI001F284409|nr:GspH/FimT family protein [Shewanella sp. AS16]MCE9685273.1 GspH/FimT family protein [Shewanella sp. AS16]
MKQLIGVTLIELLTTLAIALIGVLLSVPSLSSLYEKARADSAISRIQQTLLLARNQAINLNLNVSVCALEADTCTDNWESGLVVFTDSGEPNKLDGEDKILQQTDAFDSKDTLNYNRTSVRFQADGLASGSNGTFKYCPGSLDNPNSRAVVVNSAGRVRRSLASDISCSN